jgi:WD40 repeat protein
MIRFGWFDDGSFHALVVTRFGFPKLFVKIILFVLFLTKTTYFRSVLISGGEDGCVRIWECNRSESDMNVKTIRAHSQCVSALDVSWCGQAIASGADDLR